MTSEDRSQPVAAGNTAAGGRGTWLLLVLMPLFFSTNPVFGRIAVDAVGPWTLAFLRWFLAFLLLAPFIAGDFKRNRAVLTRNAALIALLGFLGMWVCGGMFYYALSRTTATNGTLIYTTTPVLIIVLEALFRGRRIALREIFGIWLAFAGMVGIVTAGHPARILSLDINGGDAVVALSALAWAVYSVVLKREALSKIPGFVLLGAIALAGAVELFPFMVGETILTGKFPASLSEWTAIGGIVVFSSVLSFGTYQYGVRAVGPAVTGIFLYLLPIYGVALAILFIGEELHLFHVAGCVLVLGGVIVATLPLEVIRRWRG